MAHQKVTPDFPTAELPQIGAGEGNRTLVISTRLPSISRRISSALCRMRLTAAMLRSTPIRSKASSAISIMSSLSRCAGVLRRRGRPSLSRLSTVTARRVCGRSSLRKRVSATTSSWISARSAAKTGMTKWIKLVWVKRVYLTRDAEPGYAPEPDYTKPPGYGNVSDKARSAVVDASYAGLFLTLLRSTLRFTRLSVQSISCADAGGIKTFFPGHQFCVSTTKYRMLQLASSTRKSAT